MSLTKTCDDCFETKPLTDFYPHARNLDGRRGKCKVCMIARAKARYEKNRPAILVQAKDRYLEQRQARIEKMREYRATRKTSKQQGVPHASEPLA